MTEQVDSTEAHDGSVDEDDDVEDLKARFEDTYDRDEGSDQLETRITCVGLSC